MFKGRISGCAWPIWFTNGLHLFCSSLLCSRNMRIKRLKEEAQLNISCGHWQKPYFLLAKLIHIRTDCTSFVHHQGCSLGSRNSRSKGIIKKASPVKFKTFHGRVLPLYLVVIRTRLLRAESVFNISTKMHGSRARVQTEKSCWLLSLFLSLKCTRHSKI